MQRKKTSSGQAIVMVTLALVAMAGMMGLAVDLGWSFFVQRAAQASADGAALAAVQEAYRLNGATGVGNLSCSTVACTGASTITPCPAPGNLSNGCLYAVSNGFDYVNDSRTKVTMQSDVCPSVPCAAPNLPPTVPGVTYLKYWVTVRTVQTIPQLFSAVLGNTQGTVSAIATAAIVGEINPGSFWGMNREGDCLTGDASNVVTYDCGVDIDVSGANTATCVNVNGTPASPDPGPQKVCAPAGIFLASRCDGSTVVGCGDSANSKNGFAGQTDNQATVWAQSGTQIRDVGWVGRQGNIDAAATNWRPNPPKPTNHSGAEFIDQTHNLTQPPLINAAQPTCAVPGGTLTSGTLGPFQYYAAVSAVNHTPTGFPLTIGNGVTITFNSSSTNKASSCPGFATTDATSNGGFSTFTFWGGLNINGSSGTTINYGAGQYVLAGTTNQTGPVFSTANGQATGDSTHGGTMFIFTDGSYNGALAAPTGMLPLYFGYVDVKDTSMTLTGITSDAGASLKTDYLNFLFWNDRRNSRDSLDPSNGDCASGNCHGALPASVTFTSPQIVMEPGNAALALTGILYQPRGAWFNLKSGGAAATGALKLSMFTGALTCGPTGGACGAASVRLAGPAAPLQSFVTALIQ